jgi:phosphoserine phosphatase
MENGSYKWDFFLAHAGADKEAAGKLYELLTPDSRVFLDLRCLLLGDDWDTELPAAQSASHITVVLVSSTTDKAYYQREEIAAAIALARAADQKHRVVPVYLGGEAKSKGDIPYGLRLKEGLTLSDTVTMHDVARELLGLLTRLKAGKDIPSKPDAPQSAPGAEFRGILHQPPPEWVSPVRRNRFRYKVVALDLDGTLLRGQDFEFSWEAVWKGLGFGMSLQNELKREYKQRCAADLSRSGRIKAYQEWCDKACGCFKQRGLTRSQLKDLSRPLRLTRNCREALVELRKEGIVTAIVSGGINAFLEDTFHDFRDYVDFVFINELVFSPDGNLEGVRATDYDFQGKAEALGIVSEKAGCSTAETVFIGDHFNDEAIMLKAKLAIAYPPKDLLAKDASQVSILEDNLMAILPHILVE